MSFSLHYSTIINPSLVDIVDEEWARETLPDDGACCFPDLSRCKHENMPFQRRIRAYQYSVSAHSLCNAQHRTDSKIKRRRLPVPKCDENFPRNCPETVKALKEEMTES